MCRPTYRNQKQHKQHIWWNIFIHVIHFGVSLTFHFSFFTACNNSTLFTQTWLNTSRQRISNRPTHSGVFSQWHVTEQFRRVSLLFVWILTYQTVLNVNVKTRVMPFLILVMKGCVGLQLNERKSDSARGSVIPLLQIKAHSSYTVETQRYRWSVKVFNVTRLGLCDTAARQQCKLYINLWFPHIGQAYDTLFH